jgi:hypothetical protein
MFKVLPENDGAVASPKTNVDPAKFKFEEDPNLTIIIPDFPSCWLLGDPKV